MLLFSSTETLDDRLEPITVAVVEGLVEIVHKFLSEALKNNRAIQALEAAEKTDSKI